MLIHGKSECSSAHSLENETPENVYLVCKHSKVWNQDGKKKLYLNPKNQKSHH